MLATYKQVMGKPGGNSALAQSLLAGNDTELLRRIVRDLEDIKRSGGVSNSGPATGTSASRDAYKYMDDKTLYSSDG